MQTNEVRVYVKAKNASPALMKEIKPTPIVIKNSKIKETKKSSHRVSDTNHLKRSLEVITNHKLQDIHGDKKTFTQSHFPILKKKLQEKFSLNQSINWGSQRNPYLRKKEFKINKHILSFALSVFGAVLIGIVMGLSILSLFFSNHTNQSSFTIDSHLSKQAVQKNNSQLVSLPPLNVVMLQAGIFEQQDRAQLAISELNTHGINAVMSIVAPFRVFLGLATNDTEANQLAAICKKEKIDVYKKELNLERNIKLAPNQQKLGSLLKKGNYIVAELSKSSSQNIISGVLAPRDEKISQYYQQFYRESGDIVPHFSSQGQQRLTEMRNALSQVIQTLNAGENNTQKMWNIQEKLARYVIAYEGFLNTLHSN